VAPTSFEITENDWIVMYNATSTSVSNYITWEWIGKATREGSITFKAPDLGKFFFRYFFNKSYRLQAVSNVVGVGPEFILTPTVINERKCKVTYSQKTGNFHSNAWIGLYEKNELENSQYKNYQWLSSATNSSLTFDIPKAGRWEFRLFPYRNLLGPYIHVSSCVFSTQGQDKLELSADPLDEKQIEVKCKISTLDLQRDSVWIGVYFADEKNNRLMRRYKSLDYSPDGACAIKFKKPIHKGQYEVRLFANRSYDILAKSNVLDVDGL
jgi:hypothetical protein